MRLNKYLGFFLLTTPISGFTFQSGTVLHLTEHNQALPEVVSMMREQKINSFRVDYIWSHLEKQPGIFKPYDNKLETLIQNSASLGLHPVVILGAGNSIYKINHPNSEADIKMFQSYVAWTAKHFKGKGVTYEVWNEWTMAKPYTVSRSMDSAEKYYHLVEETQKTIKKIDPDAKVIAGDFNPFTPDEKKWAQYLVKLGIMKNIDGLAIHPYLYSGRWYLTSAKSDIDKLADINKNLENINQGKKIKFYITEIGIPSSYHFLQSSINNYREQYMDYAKSKSYIQGVWWYELIDDKSSNKTLENNFGIYNGNYKLK